MDNSEESQQDKTNERLIPVTPEDAIGALDFWHHFKIPIPSAMQAAFDNFIKDPTYENVQELKLQVTTAIATSDHEAFKDEIFSKIYKECVAVSYDMSFERQIQSTLSSED